MKFNVSWTESDHEGEVKVSEGDVEAGNPQEAAKVAAETWQLPVGTEVSVASRVVYVITGGADPKTP